MFVVGCLFVLGIIRYQRYRGQSRTVAELKAIRLMCSAFEAEHFRFPSNIDELQSFTNRIREEEPLAAESACDGVRNGRYSVNWGLSLSKLHADGVDPWDVVVACESSMRTKGGLAVFLPDGGVGGAVFPVTPGAADYLLSKRWNKSIAQQSGL